MLDVVFQLEKLRCVRQYDGGGPSEPYLWAVYFHIDSGSISDSVLGFVATNNQLSGLSCRQTFATSMRPGDVAAIPESVGRNRILLDDSSFSTPSAGMVFALLEENETSDNLMRTGHRVFGEAFHEEINSYVSHHLPDVPPLSEADKAAMAKRIQDRVFAAVKKDAGFWEAFNTADRFIGFGSEFFTWPMLTLLRDRAPGKPYPLSHTVRSSRAIPPFSSPPLIVVDEYEITGSIRVSTHTPPTPDPCQAQRDAAQLAAAAVKNIDSEVAELQSELRLSSGPQKSAILQQIAELRKQRKALQANVESTHKAYLQCRSQHPLT